MILHHSFVLLVFFFSFFFTFFHLIVFFFNILYSNLNLWRAQGRSRYLGYLYIFIKIRQDLRLFLTMIRVSFFSVFFFLFFIKITAQHQHFYFKARPILLRTRLIKTETIPRAFLRRSHSPSLSLFHSFTHTLADNTFSLDLFLPYVFR